jgi:predicted esterase
MSLMMKFPSKLFGVRTYLVLICLLSACNRLDLTKRLTTADDFAKSNGFRKEFVQADGFSFTAYSKVNDPKQPYNIYIEGDGLAFLNRYTVSDNPTPTKLMLFKLASLDKRPNVIYLARPCQFTSLEFNPKCNDPKYWTSDRLSEESVAAMNQAVAKLSQSKPVNLVGFSGGGAIAVLIAARNTKVSTIITIAGNLDHVAFNSHHHYSPMHNSLNPIDYAAKVKHIPQLHISGSKDTRVPSFITQSYVATSASQCVQGEIIQGASHETGWDKVWTNILARPLSCN